jgi:hypothetical protein
MILAEPFDLILKLMTKTIRVVTATKVSEKAFWTTTWLGRSLRQLQPGTFSLSVISNNLGAEARGLPDIYNQFLTPDYRSELLLFVHDDVWIHDVFLTTRLNEALLSFDVVGVAGNRNPEEPAVSWAHVFKDGEMKWQEKARLSGAISHGRSPFSWDPKITWYGQSPAECKLLDGVLVGVNMERVLETGVRFDEKFRFHFYDLDFSRQCTNAGLKLGTWPIAICHGSGGAFRSPQWIAALEIYLRKWYGESAAAIARGVSPLSPAQLVMSRSKLVMSIYGRCKRMLSRQR